MTLVPSLLQNMLLYLIHLTGKDLLPYLKRFICSGETLTPELAKMFFQYFKYGKHELCNFYGATEFTADGTYYQISNWEQIAAYSSVPIGKAINNTRIYILDEEMKQVKEGQIGELYVAGKSVCLGYVNGRNPDRYMVNPFSEEECKFNFECPSFTYSIQIKNLQATAAYCTVVIMHLLRGMSSSMKAEMIPNSKSEAKKWTCLKLIMLWKGSRLLKKVALPEKIQSLSYCNLKLISSSDNFVLPTSHN